MSIRYDVVYIDKQWQLYSLEYPTDRIIISNYFITIARKMVIYQHAVWPTWYVWKGISQRRRHDYFGYRENHQITPAARRVERQALSDFYWLKTLNVPSVAQVPGCVVSRLNGSCDPDRRDDAWRIRALYAMIILRLAVPRDFVPVEIFPFSQHSSLLLRSY